jgi:hypothetical protein
MATLDRIDLSKSPVLRRPKIERRVKSEDAAKRITARYEHGGVDRMVRAELKRQRRAARNRRIVGE